MNLRTSLYSHYNLDFPVLESVAPILYFSIVSDNDEGINRSVMTWLPEFVDQFIHVFKTIQYFFEAFSTSNDYLA